MSERGTRNSTLFGTAIMLMFFVTTTRLQLPVELFYLFLAFILLFQAVFFHLDTGELVIDTRNWSIEELPPQLVAGVAIGTAIGGPLVFLGTARPPEDFLGELVTQTIFVTFVETIFMVVLVRTIRFRGFPLGLLVQPPLFGFMHAAVRVPWLTGQFTLESLAFFGYATLFGFFFEGLYVARDYLSPKSTFLGWPLPKFFGAVTVQLVHLVLNLILVLVRVQAGTFELFPLLVSLGVLA